MWNKVFSTMQNELRRDALPTPSSQRETPAGARAQAEGAFIGAQQSDFGEPSATSTPERRIDQYADGMASMVGYGVLGLLGHAAARGGGSGGLALHRVAGRRADAAHQQTRQAIIGTRAGSVTEGPQGPAVLLACEPYDAYKRLAARTNSTIASERAKLLAAYNESIAPWLSSEESALQMLAMDLAYNDLSEGDRIATRITRSLDDKPINLYAQIYVVTHKKLLDADKGLSAFFLEPHGEQASAKSALLLFRGTVGSRRLGMDGPAHATGWASDFDLDGVGFNAIAANLTHLRQWIVGALRSDSHRGVTILGHSLGGAYATRMMADAPALMQPRLRLVTYNAPGIESGRADSIIGGFDNVRRIAHQSTDFVSEAGERHPKGLGLFVQEHFVTPESGVLSHTLPYFAIREMRGEQSFYVTGESGIDNHLGIELGRISGGLLFKNRLPR